MDGDVRSCVLGNSSSQRIVTKPATIAGYRKVCLPHETYPVLVPDANRCAEGILLDGLDRRELDRIVFFEGEEYELSPCTAALADGSFIDALFFDEGIMPRPQSKDWSFSFWVDQHKDYMLRQTAHYMSYFGLMSAVEADQYWQTYQE